MLDLCALTRFILWATILVITPRNEGWASYFVHNVDLQGQLCEEYIGERAGWWDKITDTIIISKLGIGVRIFAQKLNV